MHKTCNVYLSCGSVNVSYFAKSVFSIYHQVNYLPNVQMKSSGLYWSLTHLWNGFFLHLSANLWVTAGRQLRITLKPPSSPLKASDPTPSTCSWCVPSTHRAWVTRVPCLNQCVPKVTSHVLYINIFLHKNRDFPDCLPEEMIGQYYRKWVG